MKVAKPVEYKMPKLAMAMNEGTVAQWLIKSGDYVKAGDPLATIETEKVAYDVESPEEGYFFAVAAEGETHPCESLLAWFSPDQDFDTAPVSHELDAEVSMVGHPQLARASNAIPPSRIKASPLAKKIANDHGVDLSLLKGTGPGGRIVKRDVLAALSDSSLTKQLDAQPPQAVGETALISGQVDDLLATIPLSGMRGAIATRTQRSLQETAQLSASWESDVTELLRVREDFVARADTLGTRVSVNAFLAKALMYAVRRVPMANAIIADEAIKIHSKINLGIAISKAGMTEYDSALVVGVLHDVGALGVVELDLRMRQLIDRVRAGNATTEDLSGSTITMSSTAGIGPPGLVSTPVLNQPNVALVGPSTPIDRPVVVDGEVVVRTMMPMSFTFDHRALDGEPAARFMSALSDALSQPHLMLA